jgi:hypothetical protein
MKECFSLGGSVLLLLFFSGIPYGKLSSCLLSGGRIKPNGMSDTESGKKAGFATNVGMFSIILSEAQGRHG